MVLLVFYGYGGGEEGSLSDINGRAAAPNATLGLKEEDVDAVVKDEIGQKGY